MKKIIILLGVVVLFQTEAFGQSDVFIDLNGNVETGASAAGRLEVQGDTDRNAVVGITDGTGKGVYGENQDGNGYAGYFLGNARVTGNLTVNGTLSGETDPIFSVWDKSSGISITESQITDLNHFTTLDETDPQVGTISLNYVPKWDGSSLASSSIFDNGNIGIGTATPGYKLEVVSPLYQTLKLATSHSNSTVRLTGAATGIGGFFIDANGGNNYLALMTGGVEKMRINLAGNVGIGTSSPSEKLSVTGTIESTSGGIKFPDGSVQTTASVNVMTPPDISHNAPANVDYILSGPLSITVTINDDEEIAYYVVQDREELSNNMTSYADEGVSNVIFDIQRTLNLGLNELMVIASDMAGSITKSTIVIDYSMPDNDGDGYSPLEGDCNDNNADVLPGQTNFFASPDPLIGYDYNCDSIETKQYPPANFYYDINQEEGSPPWYCEVTEGTYGLPNDCGDTVTVVPSQLVETLSGGCLFSEMQGVFVTAQGCR